MTAQATQGHSGEHSTAHDRRKDERFVTIFRVGKITRSDGDQLCMLRNISKGGAMAHVTSSFTIDEEVKLDLRLDEGIAARVSWVRGQTIGLAFSENIDLSYILAAPGPSGPKPRAPRLSVAAQGRLQVGHDIHQIVITDISQTGAKLFVGINLTSGSPTRIWIDGLPPRTGVVRWFTDGMSGVCFDRQLEVGELNAWAQAVRAQCVPRLLQEPTDRS